jgi:hypothetical protein
MPQTISGNAPSFSAYLRANQTISGNTYVKLAANTEEFDTNSNYDNATNYRFTPSIAGYYQINGCINMFCSSGPNDAYITIYKNGTRFKDGDNETNTSGTESQVCVSALIYFNGSTDYVELYGKTSQGSGTIRFNGGQAYYGYFQGSIVRGNS